MRRPFRINPFFYQSVNAPVPNRPFTLGVCALIEKDGAYLLERRSDCGRWCLVGGSIDGASAEERGVLAALYDLGIFMGYLDDGVRAATLFAPFHTRKFVAPSFYQRGSSTPLAFQHPRKFNR